MDMFLAVLPAPAPSPASPLRHSPPPAAATAASHAKIREIFMPALSSTMTEVKIVSWVKSEGDKLSKAKSVFVFVESDKLSNGENIYDGYIVSIMVKEGGVAPLGSAIALLAKTDDEIVEAKANYSSPFSHSHRRRFLRRSQLRKMWLLSWRRLRLRCIRLQREGGESWHHRTRRSWPRS